MYPQPGTEQNRRRPKAVWAPELMFKTTIDTTNGHVGDDVTWLRAGVALGLGQN